MKRVKDLLIGMKKNGHPWHRRGFVPPVYIFLSRPIKDGTPMCVLAQGFYYLGIKDIDAMAKAYRRLITITPEAGTIGFYNDRVATSYEEAYEYAERILAPFKDHYLKV